MSKLLILMLTAVLTSLGFSQEYSQEELSQKLKNALNTMHTGQGLTTAGIGLNVAGIVIYAIGLNKAASTETDYYDDSDDSDDSVEGAGQMLGGLVLMITGDVCLGVGIPLWIVGGSRASRYKRMLKQYDKGLSFRTSSRGIGLYYNF